MDGRTGYSLGIGGWQGLKREFHVEVDDHNDFPEVVMQIPSLITEGAAVPWGSAYPGDNSGLVVLALDRLERLDHTNYIMLAAYGPPLAIENPRNILDHWEWDVSGGLQFEKVDYDLNQVPLASPKYRPVFGGAANQPDLFYTNHNKQDIALELLKNEFEQFEGAMVPRTQATLTGFRKVHTIGDEVIGRVLGQLGTVNKRPFQGAEKGALRFIALDVRPVGGMLGPFTVIIIQPGDLRHHEITIVFEWNPKLHDPHIIQHKKTWDDGTSSVIYDGNEPESLAVRKKHQLHRYVDFMVDILTPFE